jgi:hypothetical protein
LVSKKKTINCGVCIKGDDGGAGENYYYGIIKEIMQVEYPGEPTKQLVLLNCEWFDVAVNRGVKVHPQYGILLRLIIVEDIKNMILS